jgi:uncharacterized protein
MIASVRTCLVCRSKANREELFRFVRALDGEICFDEKGVLPGRGAWLCVNKTCLIKGLQKRMLFRNQKNLPLNAMEMIDFIRSRIKTSALARFGLMKKQGQIEVGKDAIMRAIRKDKAGMLIFTRDFSYRSINDLLKKTDGKECKAFHSSFLMEEMGHSLGRKKTGVVALQQSRITDEILRQLTKLKKLEQ